MELKFLKIELNNFASFSNSTLDLADMGSILVTGRNHCKLDNAYSNGSGKSSVFNAICYALTGETSQGITNGVENIFANPDDCWVELTFMADNDEFVVRRIKTPRPDLKIYINGEDKSGKGIRESAKLLATYLPDLTSELLSSIIILGQGLPQRFSNNKPAGRKEILEKLTKSDFMIQSIKDKLETRLNDLKLGLRAKEDELLANNTQLDVYNNQLIKLSASMQEYEDSELSIDDQIASIEALITQATTAYDSAKLEANNLTTKINELNDKKSSVILNSNKELTTKLATVEEGIKDSNSQVAETSAEIKMLEKEIKKLDAITDICPTCGQKIPEVSKPDTTKEKAKLSKLKDKLAQCKEVVNNLEMEKSDTITQHEKDNKGLVSQFDADISELNTNLKATNNNAAKAFDEKNKATDKLYKLKNMKDNYAKLIDEISTTNDLISELTKSGSKLSVDITTVNSHINVVQQMITLAKREFRGVLLANIIEFINKKVKQYSKEVFGTDKLDFTLNENCIDITYCDKIYENMSGGEKQKIDIIIQLALREILSKQLNIHSNLLILDEIYDNMDSISCQKITNLISTLTDIDSIFIISHHAGDLEITYDNNLQVSKNENGISSLSFI